MASRDLTRSDSLDLMAASPSSGVGTAATTKKPVRGGAAQKRKPKLRPFPQVAWLTFDIIGTVFDVYGSLLNGIAALAKQHRLTMDADKYILD